MTEPTLINSDSYWDGRFATDWESFDGPRQSRFFARLAIENLPPWLISAIKRDALTLADWGCAQGDGTDVWAAYVSAVQITGVDFSRVAVEQARQRYPTIAFVSDDWLATDSRNQIAFDIVFSSNTLEHFHEPYKVLETISQKARKAIVLALPFQEMERIGEHFFSFIAENIPLKLKNGFRLAWSQVVDCRNLPETLWGGDQVFLVYAADEWIDELGIVLSDVSIVQRDNKAQIRLLMDNLECDSNRLTNLQAAIKDRETQVHFLNQQMNEQVLQATERETEIVALREENRLGKLQITELIERETLVNAEAGQLKARIDEQGRELAALIDMHSGPGRRAANLQMQAGSAVNQVEKLTAKICSREAIVKELRSEKEALQKQVAELSEQLNSWQRVAAMGRDELMQLSDWARRIESAPVAYAFKKRLIQAARAGFRMLPVKQGVKQQLRQAVVAKVRRLRRSMQPIDSAGENSALMPAVMTIDVAKSNGRDLFFFAVIDWHFRIQRPQHLAKCFAKAGQRVFYFSNNLVDDDKPGYQIERLDPHLPLYQIRLHAAGAPAIYFAPPTQAAQEMLRASLAQFIIDVDAFSTVSVVQHAYWYPVVTRLPNSYRVYDCMDYHEGFGNVPEPLIEIEKEMLNSADLVVVTSGWLETHARHHNESVAVIRNAGEYQFFSQPPASVYIDAAGRKIIGYYGAIAEWFDLDLVKALATGNPDCLILLVGNDTVGASTFFASLGNVALTGEVPYGQLPYYLYAFDVCLLPFKVIPLTLATNPVKVYEYLAAGKPVVCVDLPEVEQFGEAVYKAGSSDDFVAKVKIALQPDAMSAGRQAMRREFASVQTWDRRIEEMGWAIQDLTMPKVSVIVLTYNNLDFTKACLASLIERTDYGNLEIIVVDNASADDTPDFLRTFERTHSGVKIILNDQNLGFAAGNNVGLAAATGDFLVILNNDTVVTKGWALTMLRHLQRDPSIGLIGPITNNIGNEARVETTYRDVADMPREAVAITLPAMGVAFEIQNAAFFCVMLPRSTYERCGPISEEYGRGFFEDDDYCRLVEVAGLRVLCADDVFVHHHLSASFGKLNNSEREALIAKNRALYEAKWGGWKPHAYRRNAALAERS